MYRKGIIGAVIQSTREVLTKLNELIESLVQTLQANFQKVVDSFNKEILPKLKEISEKIVNILTDAFEKLSDIFFAYIGKVSQFIDEHQGTFKEIASSFNAVGQGALSANGLNIYYITELFADLGRFLVKSYESLRKFFVQQYKTLSEEFKALPVYEELKKQLSLLQKQYAKDVDQVFKVNHLLEYTYNVLTKLFLETGIVEDRRKVCSGRILEKRYKRVESTGPTRFGRGLGGKP